MSISGLEGLNFASETDVDVALIQEFTIVLDDFLNFSDPGTLMITDALQQLANDPNRVADPDELANERTWIGESDRPYLQFTVEFWRGGSRDLVAAQAAHHLAIAAAAGYKSPAASLWSIEPQGTLSLESEKELNLFVSNSFRNARTVAEAVSKQGAWSFEETKRLFELVDDQHHLERVVSWLRRVSAQPLRDPLDLVTQLILEWEPAYQLT